jgi:glucosylceramidase
MKKTTKSRFFLAAFFALGRAFAFALVLVAAWAAPCLILLHCAFAVAHESVRAEQGTVRWVCSTDAKPWVDQPALTSVPNDLVSFGDFIPVDPARKYQQIDGWGGCFNERGWKAMEVLSDTDRQAVLKSLFDPNDGLKLNLCRSPIGASDYGIDLYSLDETPGDYDMQHFSIDRDRQRLIPYIKAAQKLRPDLKVWGVPWSPPSWMKDSGQLAGGKIKDDDRTMDALGLYFVKYVQAYRAEGIPLYMVMPQNEPCYATKYTSCLWTGAQLTNFIGKHLGPAFEANHVDCEIYLGTLPRSDAPLNDYVADVAPALSDPQINKYITGIGCQWGGDQVMRDVQFLHPEMKLMQTENECGQTNTNDWAFAIHQFNRARTYFDAGANASMIWNMVLDETGLSTANWAQCSPIVIDQKTATVRYTPYYWCYKHFSYFIKPGAHRIAIGGAWGDKLAFENPDGEVIVILANTSDKDLGVSVMVAGRTIKPTLPAMSFNTFCIPPQK